MFQVEKNIPIPKGYGYTYPFREMNVGDSFEFDEAKRNTVSSSAKYFARGNDNWKFAIRKVGDGKCRIWRTA